jgi:hypothetical protein
MTRWVPDRSEALSRVRLRAGRELAVINVSAGGVCVEGPSRLLPGTHIEVHITTVQGRILVRARVVRCTVCTVTADVITYRGALAFATPVDLPPGEVVPHHTSEAAMSDQRLVEPFQSVAEPA